jgi:hypothetical protein
MTKLTGRVKSPQWWATHIFGVTSVVHWLNGFLIFSKSFIISGLAGQIFHAVFDACLHCILHATLLGCIVCKYRQKELIRCLWLRLLFEAVITIYDFR